MVPGIAAWERGRRGQGHRGWRPIRGSRWRAGRWGGGITSRGHCWVCSRASVSPQHCPASSSPEEPGQLLNAVRKPCRASQHRLSSSISLPCPTLHLLVEEAVPNQEGEGFVLLALLRPKAQAPKGSSGQPPAGLTFQSIRDAPKTQHGLEASLNPKEREQSSCLKQILTGKITAAPDPGEAAPTLPGAPGRGEGKKNGAEWNILMKNLGKETPRGGCLRRSRGRGQRLAALLPAAHQYAASERAELNVSGATRAFQPAHAPGLTLSSSGTLPVQEKGRRLGLQQVG